MKKVYTLFLGIAILSGTIFATAKDFAEDITNTESSCHSLQVIRLDQLGDEQLNEIMNGKHPEIAIEFPVHTLIPVHFFLKGDVIQLQGEEKNFGMLDIKQTVYIKYVEEELFFSSNLKNWKPFLQFITGQVSVSLHIHDQQPQFKIGADLQRRSN